jgi:hypothetical protein
VNKLPETTRAWLRQTAKFEGGVTAQVLEHLLERMESLEARDTEDANRWASMRQSMHCLRKCIEALERRPTPGTVELAAPTPEAAPVATDKELSDCWVNAAKVAILNRRDYDKALTPADVLKAQIRAAYDFGRQHGAAQPPAPQPAPPAAAIRAALERLVKLRSSDTHALLGSAWHEAFAAACAALAQPPAAQPAPEPAMQRLMEAPMDARGYVDLREPPAPQPAPPAAPYGKTAEQTRRDRAGELGKAAADVSIDAVLAAQPPAPQPAPPAAPAGGLVERVEARAGGDGRAAIREVAAWLDSNAGLPDDATPCEADGWELAAHILNREADR